METQTVKRVRGGRKTTAKVATKAAKGKTNTGKLAAKLVDNMPRKVRPKRKDDRKMVAVSPATHAKLKALRDEVGSSIPEIIDFVLDEYVK